MDPLDYKLITKHSTRIEDFFHYHDRVLMNINVNHLIDGSYAAYLVYNYKNTSYRDIFLDMGESLKNPAVTRDVLYRNLKAIAANRSPVIDVREDVVAMIVRGVFDMYDNGNKVPVLMYSKETRISGTLDVYNIKQVQVQLEDGTTAIGQDIDFNEVYTNGKVTGNDQHFLTHILRSHRTLN